MPLRSTKRSARRRCARSPGATLPRDLLTILAAQPVRIAAPLFAGHDAEQRRRRAHPRRCRSTRCARWSPSARGAAPNPRPNPRPSLQPADPRRAEHQRHGRAHRAAPAAARADAPPGARAATAAARARWPSGPARRSCSNGKATPRGISTGSTGRRAARWSGVRWAARAAGCSSARWRRAWRGITRSSTRRWRSAS